MLILPLTITHNKIALTLIYNNDGTTTFTIEEQAQEPYTTTSITLPEVLIMVLTNHLLAIIHGDS